MERVHISICICTYKRPEMLGGLLEKIQKQKTESLFTYSAVIVDNDKNQTGKDIVNELTEKLSFPMNYYVESEKNIALARNRTIENSTSNYIAFIDDDEFPIDEWLLLLYKTIVKYDCSGVLGPVKPYFNNSPPNWLLKGNFCDRHEFVTGTSMNGSNCGTGNVMLKRSIFDDKDNLFRIGFKTGGEDVDLFMRLFNKGYKLIWCNEAIVYETVVENRQKMTYFIKRALLQGGISYGYCGAKKTLFQKAIVFIKSSFGVMIYGALTPASILFGKHVFLRIIIKFCHHFGRTMKYIGVSFVKDRNI